MNAAAVVARRATQGCPLEQSPMRSRCHALPRLVASPLQAASGIPIIEDSPACGMSPRDLRWSSCSSSSVPTSIHQGVDGQSCLSTKRRPAEVHDLPRVRRICIRLARQRAGMADEAHAAEDKLQRQPLEQWSDAQTADYGAGRGGDTVIRGLQMRSEGLREESLWAACVQSHSQRVETGHMQHLMISSLVI